MVVGMNWKWIAFKIRLCGALMLNVDDKLFFCSTRLLLPDGGAYGYGCVVAMQAQFGCSTPAEVHNLLISPKTSMSAKASA